MAPTFLPKTLFHKIPKGLDSDQFLISLKFN